MRELVILSGKGGTRKTSITAAFASLAQNMVLCDADVDAADLHLILKPDFKQTFEFNGLFKIRFQDQMKVCCIHICITQDHVLGQRGKSRCDASFPGATFSA